MPFAGMPLDFDAMKQVGSLRLRATLWAAAVLMPLAAEVAGCAGAPRVEPGSAAPAHVDAQREFASILCEINDRRGADYPVQRPCSQTLAAGGEPDAVPRHRVPDRCCYTLVVVPWMFGERVAHIATPFSDSYERLSSKGHEIIVLPVSGRGSSAVNTRLISEVLASWEPRHGKVVMIGYSKGVADALEALVLDPGAPWARKVCAVVGVAGVVSGTPIADETATLYERLLSSVPWPSCGLGDGGGPRSMTRSERSDFLARHTLPGWIRY